MRNANKSPKISCSTMVMKIDLESISGIGAPSKVNRFFQLVGPITTSSFSNPAQRIIHRQTDRQTERTIT